MRTKNQIARKPGDILTDAIPYGLGRVQALVWSGAAWVGVNIYTAVTLMDDLQTALDSANLANGAPVCPIQAEVERVETFCVRVKPYYGDSLSRPARKRLCDEYARKIMAVLNRRLDHCIVRGESHFLPAGVELKRKVA